MGYSHTACLGGTKAHRIIMQHERNYNGYSMLHLLKHVSTAIYQTIYTPVEPDLGHFPSIS